MPRSLILEKPNLSRRRFLGLTVTVWLSFVLFYLLNAATIPTRFSVDDHLNYAATLALAEQHRLPVIRVDTLENLSPRIQFSNVGATRSLRPPLTYIVSAALYEIAEPLVEQRAFRVRLGAVVLGAMTVGLIFASAFLISQHLRLALAAAVVIGVSPRFVILASTNNDDIGATFSVAALLFSALLVMYSNAGIRALFIFAVAFGLALQSKYTAWLCLPWFLLYITPAIWRHWRRVIRWIPAIAICVIVAGGWWPLWNMYHYGWSDPSGLHNAATIQMYLTDGAANQRGYWSHGVSLSDLLLNHQSFLSTSLASAVGYLDWIDVSPIIGVYWFYGLTFAGALAFSIYQVSHSRDWLVIIVVGLLLMLFGFYLHHNLLRDVQPDGRYLLPALLTLLVVFIAKLSTWAGNKSWFAPSLIVLSISLFLLNYGLIWLYQGVFWQL